MNKPISRRDFSSKIAFIKPECLWNRMFYYRRKLQAWYERTSPESKVLKEEEVADVEGLPREMLLVFESQKDAL